MKKLFAREQLMDTLVRGDGLMHVAPEQAHRRILLLERDAEDARMLSQVLREHGFVVVAVRSASEMDAALERNSIDLLLIGAALPAEDGFSVCRRVRARSALPIIMLGERHDDTDRIVALELGADDYLVKPLHMRELVARIRALLRRSQDLTHAMARRAQVLKFAGWHLDPNTRQLWDPNGVRVMMTSVEIDLLIAFCRNAGRVLSRKQLLDLIHGGPAGSTERSIDVHVSRVRQRIEADPRDPMLIKTVRLGGYLFTPAVEYA